MYNYTSLVDWRCRSSSPWRAVRHVRHRRRAPVAQRLHSRRSRSSSPGELGHKPWETDMAWGTWSPSGEFVPRVTSRDLAVPRYAYLVRYVVVVAALRWQTYRYSRQEKWPKLGPRDRWKKRRTKTTTRQTSERSCKSFKNTTRQKSENTSGHLTRQNQVCPTCFMVNRKSKGGGDLVHSYKWAVAFP